MAYKDRISEIGNFSDICYQDSAYQTLSYMRIEYCHLRDSNLICRQLPDIVFLDKAIFLDNGKSDGCNTDRMYFLF